MQTQFRSDRNSKGQFVKNCTPLNKGVPMSSTQRQKISETLTGKPNWRKGIFTKIRECKTCGKQFNGEFRTYCSKICFKKGTTNENHYNWANGKTPELRRLRNLSPYREWRQLVFDRDDFTCQICGEKENLRANHIKRFINNPELRTETSNGITICQNCDLTLVLNRESQWESYFNFNLMARGVN